MENYKDKMTEGIHVIDNKYTQASLKDVCDYLNQDNVDLISARVVNYNGHYPKMEGNSLEVEVYIHDESKAEAYLARAFKDAVNDCHAQGIHDFNIELIKNSADGVVFSLTIGGHSMRESRSLDIGDIPNIPDTTEKDVSSETKLNQAFNDEFDKKIKENAEVLKSYNEYEALKALKAAYEQLPEQLTVADLSDVVHIFNICYSSPVRDKECKEKLWAEDKTFVNATCDIIGAWKHQLTGAEYDAAVKKHPFLTKLFHGSREDAIYNSDWGRRNVNMATVSKYLESCTWSGDTGMTESKKHHYTLKERGGNAHGIEFEPNGKGGTNAVAVKQVYYSGLSGRPEDGPHLHADNRKGELVWKKDPDGLSDDDLALAKKTYAVLKKKGKLDDVSDKFDTDIAPDLVRTGADDAVKITPDDAKDDSDRYTLEIESAHSSLRENSVVEYYYDQGDELPRTASGDGMFDAKHYNIAIDDASDCLALVYITETGGQKETVRKLSDTYKQMDVEAPLELFVATEDKAPKEWFGDDMEPVVNGWSPNATLHPSEPMAEADSRVRRKFMHLKTENLSVDDIELSFEDGASMEDITETARQIGFINDVASDSPDKSMNGGANNYGPVMSRQSDDFIAEIYDGNNPLCGLDEDKIFIRFTYDGNKVPEDFLDNVISIVNAMSA